MRYLNDLQELFLNE